MLLVKPPDSDQEIYLKMLSKMMSVDVKLMDALHDYLGDTLFYILSMFANLRVEFPSVEDINSLSLKINVYHDMHKKLPVPDENFSELLSEIGDKYKILPNQVYNFFKEINDKLGNQ